MIPNHHFLGVQKIPSTWGVLFFFRIWKPQARQRAKHADGPRPGRGAAKTHPGMALAVFPGVGHPGHQNFRKYWPECLELFFSNIISTIKYSIKN